MIGDAEIENEAERTPVDWVLVEKHLESVSIERMQGKIGILDDVQGRSFLLNILARDPPVHIVERVLEAYPEALRDNVSAFFAASDKGNPSLIRVLIRHFLQERVHYYSCPYPWIMTSRVSVDTAKIILEEHPQGVLHKFSSRKCNLLDKTVFGKEYAMINETWWTKLKLLLQVAETGSLRDGDSCPVHTILCHLSGQFWVSTSGMTQLIFLLKYVRATEPSLFCKQNESGDFPLHVLLRQTCNIELLKPAGQLIALLIDSNSKAAGIGTREGRLPLHLALESGWPSYDTLLAAAPRSLAARDPKTGFYPFQIAACSRTCSLDVVYTLLREDPLQAWGLLEGTGLTM